MRALRDGMKQPNDKLQCTACLFVGLELPRSYGLPTLAWGGRSHPPSPPCLACSLRNEGDGTGSPTNRCDPTALYSPP